MYFWCHKKVKDEEKKDYFRSARPSTSRTEVNTELVRQVVCQLTVWSLLDIKKDNVWKIISKDFGPAERLCQNGTKTAEWWSEEVLQPGASTSWSRFKLNQTCFIVITDDEIWISKCMTRNQEPGQSVDMPIIAKAEESKTKSTVKVKRQTQVDHVFQCEEHSLQ